MRALIATIASALVSSAAFAIAPESGIYSDKSQVGIGYVFEAQAGRYVLSITTGAADGHSALYVQSGRLGDGQAGILYRVDGRRPIEIDHADFTGDDVDLVRVGSVSFAARGPEFASISIVVSLDALPFAEFRHVLSRSNFGYGTLGCWPDLRGEWVVAGLDGSLAVPMQYNFTNLSDNLAEVPRCGVLGTRQRVEFRDPQRNAELRCVWDASGIDPRAVGRKVPGCELFLGDAPTPVFSVQRTDFGLRQFIATTAPLPAYGVPRPLPQYLIRGMRLEP